jgi:hypothetical protein
VGAPVVKSALLSSVSVKGAVRDADVLLVRLGVEGAVSKVVLPPPGPYPTMSMIPALPATSPEPANGVVLGSRNTWPLVLDMVIAGEATWSGSGSALPTVPAADICTRNGLPAGTVPVRATTPPPPPPALRYWRPSPSTETGVPPRL